MKEHQENHPPEEQFPDYFVVRDVLDLHGLFPEQVPEMVDEFLRNAGEQGYSQVRIVHGKGRSKLKWVVHQCLRGNPLVATFADAPPEAGGWGATIVELRSGKSS
ncbi:MAG: Smr/MutS family protein [candidate division KSB1 bacterium]|nr:Smr/MutS family protein [candidate division KSB1 bacterium]MDZ7413862.1 Smr/MutS family protein [candidate division KSB1 bacterium]